MRTYFSWCVGKNLSISRLPQEEKCSFQPRKLSTSPEITSLSQGEVDDWEGSNKREQVEESTATLVERAQGGDREAFGILYERFERTVFAIALRRMRNFNEAQELVQDVFMQALIKIHQLKNPVAFAGWLSSITHRMAINRMVRHRDGIALEPEVLEARQAAHGEVEEKTPIVIALENERAAKVRTGIESLRELDRETLHAFYYRGHSLLEMADEFDAPLGTIKRRLHVARNRFRATVDEYVADGEEDESDMN